MGVEMELVALWIRFKSYVHWGGSHRIDLNILGDTSKMAVCHIEE